VSYRVRAARAGDAPLLGAIERVAAGRFAAVGLGKIARGRPTDESAYLELAASGRLWVVEETPGAPVGLAIAGSLDGEGYLAEISVHPDHAGRRLAGDLIAAVESWAVAEGFTSLSLTTFRDVPWNRPYYERLGFCVLEEADAGAQLRAIRNGERSRGLDRLSPRVCMRKKIGKSA
jgi:GNAT superfamily N-acetyltransferase